MFYNFQNLDKLLFTIDNGLTNTLLSASSINKRQPRITVLYKKVSSKIKFLLFLPIKLLFKKRESNESLNNKTWLIFESLNNYNSLLPLKNSHNVFVKPNRSIIYRYLIWYKLVYCIPLFFRLLRKNKLRWFFLYMDVVGLMEESKRLISKYKPQRIVFANDINPYQIALKTAAKSQGIRTYYFQHACISKYMPPLDFTVAFLEGQDSYDKYKKIGIDNCKIELIGMIKYHSIKPKVNSASKVKKIGIALNLLDDLECLHSALEMLLQKFSDVEFIIRKHPRDSRKVLINDDPRITFSDSKIEGVFSFLGKIDLIIAGDSSIHLEAALLNVVPTYYKFNNFALMDVYDFVENNLVYFAKDSKSLLNYVSQEILVKSQVIDRAKYYDEGIRSNVKYKDVLKKYGFILE